MIHYQFRVGSHKLDLLSLRTLDLQSCSFNLCGNPRDQTEMMDYLKTLSMVKSKYPVSQLTEVEVDLTHSISVHYIAFLTRLFTVQKLNVPASTWQSL